MNRDRVQKPRIGFAVIYRWKVIPTKEEQFIAAWEILTKEILDNEGGLGSRLHKASDGTWVAYAQWPGREKWENASVGTEMAQNALRLFKDALAEQSAPIPLEPVADYLVHGEVR